MKIIPTEISIILNYFSTKNSIQFYDDDNSEDEDRFIMLGLSLRSRILVVSHCEHASWKAIRIISAREATRSERNHYSW